MKFQLTLLTLLAAGLADTHAAPGWTNAASTDRLLIVESSVMPIAAGKATLIIGALHRADGVYWGSYKIKVSPYFFRHEKGRLAIVVSDESLAEINMGKVTAIKGTATTSGKGGRSRHIDVMATPADTNRGKLKLRFTAGDREMVFEPAYHFTKQGTEAVLTQPSETNLVSILPGRLSVSDGAALENTDK